MSLPSRPLTLASITSIALATGACNAIFGISPGVETSGTGGGSGGATSASTGTGATTSASVGSGGATTSSAGSGGSSTSASGASTSSGGTGGGATCTNTGKATCTQGTLEVCDGNGHALAPQTCKAASLCDPIGQKCNDFPRIALGEARGCAIEDAFAVHCWGFSDGALVVSDPRLWIPTAEATGVNGRQLALAISSACALQDNGDAACWGWDHDGTLGVMPTGNDQIINPVPGLPPAVELAMADGCACARLASGAVDCWGTQDNGCLGTAGQVHGVQFTPTPVGSFTDAVEIRADLGNDATVCVRHAGGQVTCWGPTVTPTTVPGVTFATDIAIGDGIVFVQQATGLYWTAASGSSWQTLQPYAAGVSFSQMSAGKTVCGIEGNGATVSCASTYAGHTPPPPLATVPNLPTGTVADIAVGFGDSDSGTLQCIRLSGTTIAGNVYCWGDDAYGALGVGAPELFRSAVPSTGLPSATALATADTSSSAVVQGGGVWAWGASEAFDASGDPSLPFVVTNLGNASTSLEANDEDSLGYAFGAAGAPVLFEYGTPVQGAPERILTSGFTDFLDVKILGNFDVGRRAGGQIVVWAGTADSDVGGILGDGGKPSVTTGSSFVVPLGAAATGLAVNAAAYGSEPAHACAILTGGAVSCWGGNYFGESGQPGTGVPPGPPPSPVPPYAPTFPAGTKGIVSVAVGEYFSCATDGSGPGASGKVYCWGANDRGQLGTGMTTDYTTAVPAAVHGITNAAGVAAGPASACAWLTDGSVKCWGENDFAQLGNGDPSFMDASMPTPVQGLGTTLDVTTVSIAYRHACALHASGGVSCWGSSYDGEIGTGVTGFFTKPQQVVAL